MIKNIYKYFIDILKGGIDLLFPPLCFNCNEKLLDREKIICENCWKKIPKITEGILNNKNKNEYINEIDSLWLFDDTFQNIVHKLKYSNCPTLGIKIGEEMGEYLLNEKQINIQKTLIVPVPLHPIKKRERGYNQSEMIAKGISKVTGISTNDKLVKRIKNTATQTKMNKEERIENMQQAFASDKVIDKNFVIIVDDVYTTGTTINSVAEVIKQNNKNIQVLAFSAAMPES